MSFFWTCMQMNSVYEISDEDDVPEISEEDVVVEGDL